MPKIRGFKSDLWTDEDFVELSPFARLLWMGMWNYACDNGHLQDKSKQIKMRVLPTDDVNCAELLRELEQNGRIVRGNGWITVPNFTRHQKPDKRYFQTCEKPGCTRPSGDSQPETRGGHGEARGGHVGGSRGPHVDGEVKGSDGEGDGEDKSGALTLAQRDDVTRICDHLVNAIEANGSKRPTVTAKWLQAARLMLDKDGRTEEEVHGAIDWSQRDEFWRSNILSLPTLREKYDTLRLQAQRNQRGGTARQQAEAEMWDRAYARADQREAVQR